MFNRINKIDNDLRRKVIGKTRNGKVHGVRKLEKLNNSNEYRTVSNNEFNIDKKPIIVDCIKDEEIKIEAEKEVTEELIGNILDKRR